MTYIPIPKAQWQPILDRYDNCCVICGQSSSILGSKLKQAHLLCPRSKGGRDSGVLPVCPNCHDKFDNQLCTYNDIEALYNRVGSIKYVDYLKGKYLPKGRCCKYSKAQIAVKLEEARRSSIFF